MSQKIKLFTILLLVLASASTSLKASASEASRILEDEPQTGFDDTHHPLGVTFSAAHYEAFDELGSEIDDDDTTPPTPDEILYEKWYQLTDGLYAKSPETFTAGVSDLEEKGVRFFLEKFFDLKSRDSNHVYLDSLFKRLEELEVMTEDDYRKSIIWYYHSSNFLNSSLEADKRQYLENTFRLVNQFVRSLEDKAPLSLQNQRFIARAYFQLGLSSNLEKGDYKAKARIAYRNLFAQEGFQSSIEDVTFAANAHMIFDVTPDGGINFTSETKEDVITFFKNLQQTYPDRNLHFQISFGISHPCHIGTPERL